MRKAFGSATQRQQMSQTNIAPMEILSAFNRDSIPGRIYVESRRPDAVIDAISGIVGVYGRTVDKLIQVPIEEMADLLKLTKIEHEVKIGDWVRFKRGKYTGDLAQVIDVAQNGEEIGIKFVPRIDMNPSQQEPIQDSRGVKRRRQLGSGNNALNKRPQQQLFVPSEIQRVYPGQLTKRGNIYKFQNDDYSDGYCEKDVKVTALIVEGIQPTLAEIEMFQRGRVELGNPINDSVNLRQLAQLNQKAGQVDIQPGDYVEVFRGGQGGVRGTVDAINGQAITIDMEHAEMGGTKVEVQLDQVRKTFKPGDHVKVGSGDHIDETGMVVKIDGETTTFLSDLTMKEVTVFSKDLRQAEIGSGPATVAGFNTHDLVMCNHRAAVIYNIEREGFRILDEEDNSHLVPPRSLLLLRNTFSVCIDHEGHEIRKGDTMKEVEGNYPRSGKVIQTYQSGVVFLYNRDLSETNGVWIASPNRLTPLTPRQMGTSVKDSLDKMKPAANMQLSAVRGHAGPGGQRDKHKGMSVSVVKGPYKNRRGTILETLPGDEALVEMEQERTRVIFPLTVLLQKDPRTGQRMSENTLGHPYTGQGSSSFGPSLGSSSMSTPHSSVPNGPMGPPGAPMGSRTPYGGGMAQGMMGGGGTSYGGALSGAATPMGSRTPYGGGMAQGMMGGGGTSYGGALSGAATPMGSRTPYGGGMAHGMMGGGGTSYGGALSGAATAYGGGTMYGGQTAYGNMANGGKTPAYYTSSGGKQVPSHGVNHGWTPTFGFGGARTPFGAGTGRDGRQTPFQAPAGVTSFAGPGRGFGGAAPRAVAAAYGGATLNWSAGSQTPAHQQATGWGQGVSGAATPYHAGGGGAEPTPGLVAAVADHRRRTPNPYSAATAATPGVLAAPATSFSSSVVPTPAAAPNPTASNKV